MEQFVQKTLPLFLGCAAAVYFGLIRDRGWRVEHFSSRARTAHHAICLTLAVVVACLLIDRFQDEILCPRGHGDPEWRATSAGGGKRGNKIVCHDDGHTADGSFFAGLFAFVGSGALVFASISAVVRSFGPPAPPAPKPPPPPLGSGTPTDRRERRRSRKREQHRGRQD
jgi:hypothetical protein